MSTVLGVDLGGTKANGLLRAADGESLHTALRRTGRQLGPEAFLDLLADIIADGPHMPDAIGISFPGLIVKTRGHVLSSVILDGWTGVPICEMIEQRFDRPARIANDVHNAARAEIALRKQEPCLIYVSLGTGISGAVAVDGHLIEGARGLAGEIGHLSVNPSGPLCQCGRRGCLGPACGGEGIEAGLGLRPGGLMSADLDTPAIAAVLERSARCIGWALGTLMNVLNPSLIIFGGGMTRIGPRFLDPIEAKARSESFAEIAEVCRFETSLAGYGAGALGAADLAQTALSKAIA